MSKITVTEEKLLLQLPAVAATINLRVTEPSSATATIVLVPDFAGTCRDYDEAARFFAAQDLRAVSFDMPGRGDSAYLTPALYRIPVYLRVIACVLDRCIGHKLTLFGAGWGGIVALTFAANAKARGPRLAIADVPTRLTVGNDAAMKWFLDIAGRHFATQTEAEVAVMDSPSLRSLPIASRERIARNRIHRTAEGYRLRLDPALVETLAQVAEREFDLRSLIASVPAALVLCRPGDGWIEPGAAAHQQGAIFAEQAGEKSHCGLTDPGDWLMLLGFAGARQLAPLQRDGVA